MRWLLFLFFLFIGCTRLHNNHDEDVVDCGPELTRDQDYLTVLNARGIPMRSDFEVVNLDSGNPENLVTSKGCIIKKTGSRYLIRSTGTDEARVIDMSQFESRSQVELHDYTGQSVSVACKDEVRTVGRAFAIQSILQTNLQTNLQEAVQLGYEFVKPARPGTVFSLADASQSLPLLSETEERIYEIKLNVSNLLSRGTLEATCRLQLDRTPPQAFVSVSSRKPEETIEVHGTTQIAPVGLVDSMTFLADQNDGVTVSYCLVPLADDFDESDQKAKGNWISGSQSKDCLGQKVLTASPGAAIAPDIKSGFWSIKFQAMDAVGNVTSPQIQNVLVLNRDGHRLIRDNALSGIGAKSSMRIVESALRAEVLRNKLPTRYERDLEKDIALSGLLRAYYQDTVSVEINAHHSSVTAMALSEDGQVLASSSFDGTLKLWNVENGQNIWSTSSGSLKSIALSPNREFIAGIDLHGAVLAFDAGNGRYLRMLKARDRVPLTPTRIQFGPDNLTVMIDSGHDIEIRSLENGEILRVLKAHEKNVKDFSVVPGGRMAVSVAADKTLRYWDLATGVNLITVETKFNSQSTPQFPNQVTVSADGKRIGVRLDTGPVVFWSDEGVSLGSAAKLSTAASAIALKRDGTLFTADTDIKVWDADTIKLVLSEHLAPIVAMVISQDEQRLMTASGDSTIRIWNLRIIKEKKILEAPHGITSLVYSQDGDDLISGSLETGGLLAWSPKRSTNPKILAGHESSLGALTISGNGTYLASGGGEGDITVQEYAGVCCRRVEFKPAAAISSISLSHDGRYLVAATSNGGVKLWDMKGTDEPRQVAGASMGGTVAAISPDGSRIAVAGLGGQSNVEIRDRESGRVLFPILGNSGFINGLAFSADSQRLATFGPSFNSINVWDMSSGSVTSRALGGFKDVASLAMSASGSRAVAGTLFGQFLIIDFEREQQILVPAHGTSPSFAVAIAPDGRTFATGGYDKTIRIWDFDNGPLHENICARLKSYLDPELCRGFRQ